MNDTFSKMNAYFGDLEERIAAEAKMAGFSKHNSDKGSNREQILINILNDHLPDSLQAISGGTIFNLDGETSGQIDIIIKNETFPLFGALAKPMVPIEAVVGAIEVKSTLNTTELEKSIDLLAGIPMWDDRTVASCSSDPHEFPNGEVVDKKSAYRHNWPARMIYGYAGSTTDILHEKAMAKYNTFENKDVLPMMIAVNKATNIRFLNKGGWEQSAGGIKKLPERWMTRVNLTPQTRGYTLAGMITHLSSWVDFQSDVVFKFAPYADKMTSVALAELEETKSTSLG